MKSPTSRLILAFKVVALVEAGTWVGLLLGMYLKYVTKTTALGVSIAGPLHGAAFIAFVTLTVLVAKQLRWPWFITLIALIASVPPLTTAVFEVWAQRRGLLHDSTSRQNV